MAYAAHMQKKYYDKKHAPLPPYKIGDFVCLRLDKHPLSVIKHNKLSQQKLPPYKILRTLSRGRALELDIPPELGIHPMVSTQQVEKSRDPSTDPWGRDYPRPEAVNDD